jgi:hypothetical protein
LVLHPKPTTSWLELILHPFGVGTRHGQPWTHLTHLTHHGPDSGEATTFPHIVFSTLLRGTCIQMAFIPGTPKKESRNCPNLDSQDFGDSQLPAQASDWDEVWSKLVALLKSFPTVYRTSSTHTGIGSIPDFLWSGVKLPVWLPTLLLPIICAAYSIQGLFNGIKNTSRWGVLPSVVGL